MSDMTDATDAVTALTSEEVSVRLVKYGVPSDSEFFATDAAMRTKLIEIEYLRLAYSTFRGNCF
jgi:hypothetical protein